jgi:ABC-2 type transport system permease protein
MSVTAVRTGPSGFSLGEYATCLAGIVWREGLRFLHQR